MSMLASTDPIEFLQGFSSVYLDSFFIAVTVIFSPIMLFVFFTLVFWLDDDRKWTKAMTFMIFLGLSIILLKEFFAMQRPSEELRMLSEVGYAFPSGHTTSIVGAFALLYYLRRSRPIIVLGALISVLVMTSRVYLGLHYIRDILGGIILATAAILALILYDRRQEHNGTGIKLHWQIIIISVISLGFLLLCFRSIRDAKDCAKLSGLLLGFWAGKWLSGGRDAVAGKEDKQIKRSRGANVIRAVSGLLVVSVPLGAYQLMKMMGPGQQIYIGFTYLIHLLVGISISYAAPRIFAWTDRRFRTESEELFS